MKPSRSAGCFLRSVLNQEIEDGKMRSGEQARAEPTQPEMQSGKPAEESVSEGYQARAGGMEPNRRKEDRERRQTE